MPVYVLSQCGAHVISSEPHGVMVSTHVSGFLLFKLEFLSGGPICGAGEDGLADGKQIQHLAIKESHSANEYQFDCDV